jgi:hypothetical protein
MSEHNIKLAENFVERWFWKESDDYLNVSSKHPIAVCERPMSIDALIALLDESQEKHNLDNLPIPT